ncbi:MAG: tetratricopeptide repeat protein [Candidatus Hydrogenedentes bacterium]|nr:tetratricopeptide repeat protein [Candidatus Hydrogenedentota bacterium]
MTILKAPLLALALCVLAAPGMYAQEPAPELESPAPEGSAADQSAPDQVQFDFANGLFHRGYHKEAVAEYRKYTETYGQGKDLLLAWHRMGEAAYAARDHETAIGAMEKVLSLNPPAGLVLNAKLTLGESLFFMDRFEESLTHLSAIIAQEAPPEILERARYYMGRAHYALGAMGPAREVLRQAAEAHPDGPLHAFVLFQLAFVLVRNGEDEQAAITFSEVADSQADSALRQESRYRAAEIYDKIGWFSTAVGAYQKLKEEFPDSGYARRADYGHAWALYHAGSFAEAQVMVERYLAAFPDATEELPGLHYLRANCFQQQGKLDEALAEYIAIRERFPEHSFADRARYKEAWIYFLKNDIATARKDITAYLQEHPESPFTGEAAFLLGSIFVKEGNYEDAFEEFRLVFERFPDSEFGPEALYRAAECLEQLGLAAQAAERFEEFAKRYPENPLTAEAALRAGDAQFDAQAFAQAIEKYKVILAGATEPAVVEQTLYRLAIAYYNQRDYKASTETFQSLLEKAPATKHGAEALFYSAEYYLREGEDPVQALSAYEKLLQLDPQGPYAGRSVRGIALARFEQNDFEKAAGFFLKLLREFPAETINQESILWAGEWLHENERWADAAEVFNALLQRVPGYPYGDRVHLTIAACYEHLGKTEEARAELEAIVAAGGKGEAVTEAQFRIARLYESSGESAKARELYETAAASNHSALAAQARFRVGELLEQDKEFEQAARNFMMVAIVYLDASLSPESLWRAAQNFQQAGLLDQARKAYEEISTEYPDHARAASAKEALAALQKG